MAGKNDEMKNEQIPQSVATKESKRWKKYP
jgi:hypothetical protein